MASRAWFWEQRACSVPSRTRRLAAGRLLIEEVRLLHGRAQPDRNKPRHSGLRCGDELSDSSFFFFGV